MNAGKFICFEGIDGSGKSTQIRKLSKNLFNEGYSFHSTSEPTNGPIGSLLKNYLTKRITLPPEAEALLFAADRADHLFNTINGILLTLKMDINVICDRYILSSLAYQALRTPYDEIEKLNIVFPLPDLTIFLRRDPTIGLASKTTDSFYRDVDEHIESLTKIAINYEIAINKFKSRCFIIELDSDQYAEDEMAEKILTEVKKILGPPPLKVIS